MQPQTLDAAVAELPGANLVLVSTPGSHAAREAKAALQNGLNVMLFSDNVPLAEERALKETARQKGLLVMGPDCGTAIINTTPLAFANVVADGRTGAIAASGTGLQEFSVLLDRLGGGLRHGIRVGGRELYDEIGALSTLTAIDLLAADEQIDQIVLISKPPVAQTAPLVFERLASCGKPVIACVFGAAADDIPAAIKPAPNLKMAAEMAAGKQLPSIDHTAEATALLAAAKVSGNQVTGLYTGGTLCAEAQLILAAAGLPVSSNAPVSGATADGPNRILDLGADEYTVGRPHPMIEPAVRLQPLQSAVADASNAVILLDVVLGYGAHHDPAATIVQAIDEAATNGTRTPPLVVASVCGSRADPQNFDQQCKKLEQAGVKLCPSNCDAAQLAAQIVLQARS